MERMTTVRIQSQLIVDIFLRLKLFLSQVCFVINLNFFAVTFDPDKPPITPLGFLGTFSGGESWLDVKPRAWNFVTLYCGVFRKDLNLATST